MAALISAVYRAPHLSPVHVAIPESAPSCKAPRFSRENMVCFAELWRVGTNRGVFGKKRRNTLPTQIQRQKIKVRRVSYQKVAHKFLISVAFFLTYTV